MIFVNYGSCTSSWKPWRWVSCLVAAAQAAENHGDEWVSWCKYSDYSKITLITQRKSPTSPLEKKIIFTRTAWTFFMKLWRSQKNLRRNILTPQSWQFEVSALAKNDNFLNGTYNLLTKFPLENKFPLALQVQIDTRYTHWQMKLTVLSCTLPSPWNFNFHISYKVEIWRRGSRPWSHPVLLNTGPLGSKFRALSTRPLLDVNVIASFQH